MWFTDNFSQFCIIFWKAVSKEWQLIVVVSLKDWTLTVILKQVYSLCKYEEKEQSNCISVCARTIASNGFHKRKEGHI